MSLDTRTKGVAGAASASPHGLVQDFLNRSADHLWAFLSNGLALLGDLTKLADIESLGNVVGEIGKIEGIGEKIEELGNRTKEELDKAAGELGDLLGGEKPK